MKFDEDTFEQAVIELFENMGYTHIYAPDMNRTDYSRRDVAGQLAAGGAAHAVAHHADRAAALHLPGGESVLVVLTNQAHVRHGP